MFFKFYFDFRMSLSKASGKYNIDDIVPYLNQWKTVMMQQKNIVDKSYRYISKYIIKYKRNLSEEDKDRLYHVICKYNKS